MKRSALILICIYAVLVMTTTPVSAESTSTLRCGSKIITLGDTRYTVEAKCGKPSDREFRREKRIARDTYRDLFPAPKREKEQYREPFLVEEYVEIEEWTYNLGPTFFIRYLTFENGKLVLIETGDYGF